VNIDDKRNERKGTKIRRTINEEGTK